MSKDLPTWLLTDSDDRQSQQKSTSQKDREKVSRPNWFTDLVKTDIQITHETKDSLKADCHEINQWSARRRSVDGTPQVHPAFLLSPINPDEELKLISTNLNSCMLETFSSDIPQSIVRQKNFEIPFTPVGQTMVIEILTNWGDPDFIGLTGLEIFDCSGPPIQIDRMWTVQGKSDCDPLVLFNGVNRSHDDKNLWLMSRSKSLRPRIHIKFSEVSRLALLRVWNYDKSRIYASRGVKDVKISLDDKIIFLGEIRKSTEETILFTTDDDILHQVSKYDSYFQQLHSTS